MKLHFFGSCSGTEPMPYRHHCSFALEVEDGYYIFDAGENCSYTAHLMGVDLLRIKKVFISHSHMDHIGGLGNLFWNVRKMCWVTARKPPLSPAVTSPPKGGDAPEDIDLYLPEPAVWEHLNAILLHTEGDFKKSWEIIPHKVTDGVLCDGEVKVTALHNHHLGQNPDGWRAFGFLIEAEGKRIVYTGDTGGFADYAPLLPCDVLITETGHHRACEVARTLTENNAKVGMLIFTHHGLSMLADKEGELALARTEYSGEIFAVDDGQTMEI